MTASVEEIERAAVAAWLDGAHLHAIRLLADARWNRFELIAWVQGHGDRRERAHAATVVEDALMRTVA